MKKQQSFPLTQNIQIQLKKLSGTLHEGPMEYQVLKKYTGQELNDLNMQIKKNGKIIPPIIGQTYERKVTVLKNVNHYSMLCNSYKNAGINGIIAYVAQCETWNNNARMMYPSLYLDDGKGEYKGVIDGTMLRVDQKYIDMMKEQAKFEENKKKMKSGNVVDMKGNKV